MRNLGLWHSWYQIFPYEAKVLPTHLCDCFCLHGTRSAWHYVFKNTGNRFPLVAQRFSITQSLGVRGIHGACEEEVFAVFKPVKKAMQLVGAGSNPTRKQFWIGVRQHAPAAPRAHGAVQRPASCAVNWRGQSDGSLWAVGRHRLRVSLSSGCSRLTWMRPSYLASRRLLGDLGASKDDVGVS